MLGPAEMSQVLLAFLSSAGATPCFALKLTCNAMGRTFLSLHSIQGDIFQASKCKFLLSDMVGAHTPFVFKGSGFGGVLTTQTECLL